MSHAPCQPPPCTSIPQPREREESLCPPAPSVEGWGLGKRGLPFRRDRRLSIVTHRPSHTHNIHTHTHSHQTVSCHKEVHVNLSLEEGPQTSLVVPWLRLCTSTVEGTGSIPCWESSTGRMMQPKKIRGPSVVTGWLNECISGRTNNRSHLQSD